MLYKVVYAPDCVIYEPDENLRGIDALQQFASMFPNAFPDGHITVEGESAEGDKVVTRWTARGTHQDELTGIPPTGKQVTVTLIDINRIESGQLVERWAGQDNLYLMQQLGVISAPGET